MKSRRKKNVSGDCLTITRRNTRSKTLEGGRENSSLPIPIDVIVEIFSRLPLKSIAICRCVSKLWASILRLPNFTELFLTKSSARPQILFARLTKSSGEWFFSFSCLPQVPVLISSPVVANPLTRFTFDSSCEISCEIRGLVHGLVCVEHIRILEGRKERVLVIWNPSTGQSLTLPKLKTTRIGVRSLFGYDPIDKQFKVLSMTRPRLENNLECVEYHVLTLGGTGNLSWRMIECCIPNYYYPRNEICINGVLYYPSIDKSTQTFLLVRFDIRSEKFSFIKVEEPLKNAVFNGTMIDYNGKLGLILSKDHVGYVSWAVHRRSRNFLLWVLENPGKQEWSEHIYVLPALWNNIVGDALLRFAGVTRTNEVVLSSNTRPYPIYLLYFSLERNTVVRVDIQGTDVLNYYTHRTFLDHVEDVKLYASV